MNDLENLGYKFMLAFEGDEVPASIVPWIQEKNVAGFTLFRPKNVVNPGQLRHLTMALQQAALEAGRPPLLIATDQEGGQFVALGDKTTQFPGNMALGATRDPELAQKVGRAIGLEIAAMGVNVNYIPDCDVNTNSANPNVGVRAFGDEPFLVSEMASAMIQGLRSAGVAATAKHFPGNGGASIDPHFGVPVLDHDRERLDQVEFRPFKAAIDEGVQIVMSAHAALPRLTGKADLPATLSATIMQDLLREQLGFEGLIITDALDMKAISQGAGQIVDVIAAIRAGVDLLLLTADPEVQNRLYEGVHLAMSRGLIDQEQLRTSAERVLVLKNWFNRQQQPGLDVVGCYEHRQLEEEVARRSITLVRDNADLLPLQLKDDAKIIVIMPEPADLTPADTSSYVNPALASAMRDYHSNVDEVIVSQRPADSEINAVLDKARQSDLIVIGTIDAQMQNEQAILTKELLNLDINTVTIALRTPYDLMVYPEAGTHICTYSIQPCSLSALAAAMWGRQSFRGKLPVTIPGMADFGQGIKI
jgi:beta-N-acetylhexosaminidase